MIQIGQKLIKVKKRLGKGNFSQWCSLEFQWSERHAYRLISIAEEFLGVTDTLQPPKGIMPAYALASFLSNGKTSEEKDNRIEAYFLATNPTIPTLLQREKYERKMKRCCLLCRAFLIFI